MADQLYRSCSIYPERPHPRKIYFSENPIPDLVAEKIKHLAIAITSFNEFIQENKPSIAIGNKAKNSSTRSSVNNPIDLDGGTNLKIDKLYLEAQNILGVTSNLANVFL